MTEPVQETAKRRGRPPSRATIRCSDCGTDCNTEKAFREHLCIPVDLDYVVGTTV
jgi:hypothetical protein